MTIVTTIILGIIQGLTEFLPISSSGHLILLEHLFGISDPSVFFNVLLHVGTLLAVFFYFREKIWHLFKAVLKLDTHALRYVGFGIVATIPAGIVGIVFSDVLEPILTSSITAGIGFIITGGALLSLKKINTIPTTSETNRYQLPDSFTVLDAILIGVAQAFALLPGISRSGSTITAARWRGLTALDAFDFSFFLSIPAILGALIIQLKGLETMTNLSEGIIGGIFAGLIGIVALNRLKNFLIFDKLPLFAWYCFFIAAFTFAATFFL